MKGRPVRLLGVRFSHLIPITMQMSLFDNNAEKLNLYKAVDEIKERFGNKLVTKAVTIKKKSRKLILPRLPGLQGIGWRTRKFRLIIISTGKIINEAVGIFPDHGTLSR